MGSSSRTTLSQRPGGGGASVSSTQAGGEPDQSALSWDALGWVILGGVMAVVCATFRRYGVAWDEQGETQYGAMLIDYYRSGLRDHSAFQFVNFRFYGGGFELPAALLSRLLPLSEFATRHLLGGLVGVLGVFATWRIGRRLFGPRAGVLALLCLVLNPTWYGHTFNNARDVPFASGMALCLLLTLQMLQELPRLRVRSVVVFGLLFGWTTSVRVGGVLALLFLAAPLCLWWAARVRTGVSRAALLADLRHQLGRLCLLACAAYAVIAVLWPWAVFAPLNPLRALTMFSRFPFEADVLFDGKLIPARALPATYLPVMLAIKQPELLLGALGLSALSGVYLWLRRPATARVPYVVAVANAALVWAALFPVLYFVIARPVVYNGMRHFLFVLPPLSVLAAFGLDRLFELLALRPLRVAYGLSLAAGLGLQLHTLATLFPDEYVYYNSLVGGTARAQGRYELDYWGMSLAEATREFVALVRHAGAQPGPGEPPLQVYVCGNVWSASLYFAPWMKPAERLDEADYQIAIDEFFCKSPPGSRRVLDVKRAGARLSYVDGLMPSDRSKSRSRLAIHRRQAVEPVGGVRAAPQVHAPPPRSKLAPD